MNDALLSYLNAEDEPTANEAAAAMSAALRRRRDLGTLAALSGGRLAAPGAALLGGADSAERTLMGAQQARQARADRQAMQAYQQQKDADEMAWKKKEADENQLLRQAGIDSANNNAAAMRSMALANLGLRQQEVASADANKRRLNEGTISELAALPSEEAEVDKLADTFKRLDMGGLSGRAGSAVTGMLGLQGTDSAEYNAAALLAMQAAGKIMEGGKLAAGDEAKYRALLPRAGDAESVVQQKVQGLKSFLRELNAKRAGALKEAGYDVPKSVSGAATPPPQAQQAAPVDAKREQALAWARANPKDRRAAQILEALGAQ